MKTGPNWQYDEMKHCGVDYNDSAEVELYDKNHQKLRDYQKEAQLIIERLGLCAEQTIIDIGCGTGTLTSYLAKCYKKVYAVDVSKPMLEYASSKTKEMGLSNIEFCRGGFLTYEHCAEPVDAVVSVVALHHLPDFWKLVALRRIYDMLKPGGKFYLFDVVFSFDVGDYEDCFNGWIKSVEEKTGAEFVANVVANIRDEYSTLGWVMEGLLERAGFRINEKDYRDGFFATYLCVKEN